MLEKIFKVLFCLTSGLLVFIFIYVGMDYIRVHDKIKEENWNLRQSLKKCQEYNPFQEVVKEIGGRTYRKDYDCLDHAVDLYDGLERKGIKSVILIGENREHSWVAVEIEATDGNFIDPSEEMRIIEIRDGDLNVMCSCK